MKKEAIAMKTQAYPPVIPPTSSTHTNVKTLSTTQNITANQSAAAVQAYSQTPYFVSSPGGSDIHENSNPYHMSMSPHMYASAYQNNYDYYASQEVDPSSNMIVPFEHQTQMVEQFEPTPYPYPMNILQGEVPYPYGMVPYMPPIDDLQVVEEVEMGRYYHDPYFDDMYSSGSLSSFSSTLTRSKNRRKASVKRTNKKGVSSKVKGVKKTSNKDRKKTNEYARRKRTDTGFPKTDMLNSKRKSTQPHHTRRHSNDGSVILEIPRSCLHYDKSEIPVKSTYVNEPRDNMDDARVYTGNAFSKRTYSYGVSNRPDELNTDIRIRCDDTNNNQLPQRRVTWQTQTRVSTQPSKLSGVISHVGSYRPDADTWRHKNDRLRPELVEVQSTTVQIP